MAKCLLVDPPSSYYHPMMSLISLPSAGLLAVFSWLTKKQHKVRYLDCKNSGLGFPDIAATIDDFRPDVVGVTGYTMDVYSAMAVCSETKRIDPTIGTMMGGYHASALPELSLNTCSALDVCVVGEGEKTAEALLALRATTGGWNPHELKMILGIAYRESNGGITLTSSRPLIHDLNQLPKIKPTSLDCSLYEFPFRTGKQAANPGFTMSFSRGCTGSCSYCSNSALWHRTWRSVTPERMVSELNEAFESGRRHFFFSDNDFMKDQNRLEQFLVLLEQRQLPIHWAFETSPMNVIRSKHLLDRMKKAGFFLCLVGYEFASQSKLDCMGKCGATLESSLQAAALLRDTGIFVIALSMMGLPDETMDGVKEYVEFIRTLKPQMLYSQCLTPLPGTRLFTDLYLSDQIASFDFSEYDLQTPHLRYDPLGSVTIGHLHTAVSDAYFLPGLTELYAQMRSGEISTLEFAFRGATVAGAMQACGQGQISLVEFFRIYFELIETATPIHIPAPPMTMHAIEGESVKTFIKRLKDFDAHWRMIGSSHIPELTDEDARALLECMMAYFPTEAIEHVSRIGIPKNKLFNLWREFLFPGVAFNNSKDTKRNEAQLKAKASFFYRQQQEVLDCTPARCLLSPPHMECDVNTESAGHF